MQLQWLWIKFCLWFLLKMCNGVSENVFPETYRAYLGWSADLTLNNFYCCDSCWMTVMGSTAPEIACRVKWFNLNTNDLILNTVCSVLPCLIILLFLVKLNCFFSCCLLWPNSHCHRWCVRWCPPSVRPKGLAGEAVAVVEALAPRCSRTQRVTLSRWWCPCWRREIVFWRLWERPRRTWVWLRVNCMKLATKETRCRDNLTLLCHRWVKETFIVILKSSSLGCCVLMYTGKG